MTSLTFDDRLRGRAYGALLSRRFSPTEARRALGFKSVRAAQRAYRAARRRPWFEGEIMDAVLAFQKKHGRWPTSNDWGAENGLPARSTLALVMDTQLSQPMRPPSWRWRSHPTPSRWGKSAWAELQEHLASRRDLTAEQVVTLPNITARRTAMERYGFERLIKAKNTTLVSTDEFGKLWRFGVEDEYLMLEVTNSTPEPDGSFARYFLRVPPTMTCPKQAVAWTFGIEQDWENYEAGVET